MSLHAQMQPIEALTGTVLAVQANFYRVQLDATPPQPLPQTHLLCTRRARLKKLGQQVMTGDRVRIEEPDWLGQRGAIAEVLPRTRVLERPPIANVDQALLIFSLADPPLDRYQLSRFLVALESTGLRVIPCLSKADLVEEIQKHDWCTRLQHWGYEAKVFSTYTTEGTQEITHQLQHHLNVLAGPSGVGKSSLVNTIAPNLALRVGAISDRWRRGKHTTRHVELFALPNGGLLADTPGFSQPTLHCSPAQLIHYFPEGRSRIAAGTCQFKNCLHRDEPNCVVRGDWERYEDYLEFLAEVTVQQHQLQHTKNPEARTKRKLSAGGMIQDEPLLDQKRYRRTSRKTQVQSLDKLYEEAQDQDLR
jgi:ribosome biogenesis GTPase / thiamine phosphate phosphatase